VKVANFNAIQVVRNHDCPEPVTIGVLVHSGKDVELRLIGALDSNQRGKGEFGHAFADLVDADLIYWQWVEWFKRQAQELKVDPDKVFQKLGRLEDRGETVIASITGQVPIEDTDTLSNAASQLFEELVMVSPVMQKAKFLAAIDQFLNRTEIRFFDGLIEDAEVELLGKNGETEQLVHFPFLWDSETRGKFAGMVIAANESPRQISVAVANVMSTFGMAQQYQFTTKENCFVLIDAKLSDFYENLLNTVSKVIYINEESAAFRQVKNIFFKSRV
jgi:hypothetical protein